MSSEFPDKSNFWRLKGFEVVEKRGWVRKIRSQAKERLSKRVYEEYMKQVDWESII